MYTLVMENKLKNLTKDLSATPRELFWLNEEELAFSIDDHGASKVQ